MGPRGPSRPYKAEVYTKMSSFQFDFLESLTFAGERLMARIRFDYRGLSCYRQKCQADRMSPAAHLQICTEFFPWNEIQRDVREDDLFKVHMAVEARGTKLH